jgi:predicted  nucleic acid-binding Zn-ribbon protein
MTRASSPPLLALALMAALAAGVQTRQEDDTPVTKVITLLEDLEATITKEGEGESKTYDEFACFCKDKTTEKSESVTKSQDEIDSLSADIEENTASKEEKEEELTERKQKQEELAKELEELKAKCAAEMAEFEAIIADYDKALSSLEKATEALTKAKGAAALVEIKKSVSATLAMASAMGLIQAPKKKAVQAFLQQGVDPDDPEYKYQSQGIIDTLEDLTKTFTEKRDEEQEEWDKAKALCEEMEKDLTTQMEENDEAMTKLEDEIDKLAETIAEDRESLIEEEASLKDDQLYLKDLTERCEARAKDWDQRTSMRAKELEAIAEALVILKEGKDGASVADMDAEVNKRALLQKLAAKKQGDSAREAAVRPHSRKVRMMMDTPAGRRLLKDLEGKGSGIVEMRHHHGHHHHATDASKEHVVSLLKREGARLNSKMLSALAAQLKADPFAKVKQLIQQLIERLLHEATQEATKKGFCDTEVTKAENKRDFRFTDVQTLGAELGVLEAKKVQLEESIEALSEEIPELQTELNETTDMREEEKEENLATIKTAKEGHGAVQEAVSILRVFYKTSAKASLLQASPVDDDTEGPGFEGNYRGQQDSAKGIIGILEVIAADFDRTARLTAEAEKKAAADFEEYKQTMMADIAAKEKQKAIDEQELESTENMLKTKMSDLETAQELLDSALKTLEELKPMCIDTGMSYAERVEKREEEIAALKKALEFLKA